MYKISPGTKRRDIPEHFIEHLSFFPSFQVKFLVGGLTFFLLDLFILFPLLVPENITILFSAAPLLGLISLWATAILVRKTVGIELETILFFGCCGLVGSFAYLLVGFKYSFLMGVTSPLYYAAIAVVYFISIYFFFRHYNKKYSSAKKRDATPTPGWHYTAASIAAPLGYIAAQYLAGVSNFLIVSLITLIFYGFSYFYIFVMTKYFHKYFFIKSNLFYVRFADGSHKTAKQEV